MSSDPFRKSHADIDELTWHEARQFYLDPILERMQKTEDVPQEGQVGTDPQGQHENMLALSALLSKGKISPLDASKAFMESHGKDFRREGGDAIVARMKAMQQRQQKKPFTRSKTNPKGKPIPVPTPQQATENAP